LLSSRGSTLATSPMERASPRRSFEARESSREIVSFRERGFVVVESMMRPGPSPEELTKLRKTEMARYALREAATRGDVGGIRAALANGADGLNAALSLAIINNQYVAAQYLIDQGAYFGKYLRDIVNNYIKRNEFEKIDLITNLNVKNKMMDFIFIESVVQQKRMLILLLNNKNISQIAKNRALCLAARDNYEIFLLLIKIGANAKVAIADFRLDAKNATYKYIRDYTIRGVREGRLKIVDGVPVAIDCRSIDA
jgi:hypothetical protein